MLIELKEKMGVIFDFYSNLNFGISFPYNSLVEIFV